MDNLIAKLYNSSKEVLTTKDLALIWQESNKENLNNKVSYYVKQGLLSRLSRGVFSKNNNYNPKELASSIYKPSYISFETVLREGGVIFQHYNTIFVASKWSKELKIDKNIFNYRKLKDVLLFNSKGIIHKYNYSIASLERAFLDMIYLFPNYYFDNLSAINWDKCEDLVQIYQNKELKKRLHKYHKNYVEQGKASINNGTNY